MVNLIGTSLEKMIEIEKNSDEVVEVVCKVLEEAEKPGDKLEEIGK